MRIAHFADMHLRGKSRFDENRCAIEKFIENIERDNVDHVLVAGDLYHTKTQGITPEYIDFMCWWMSSVASVAPLHLVLGNHDVALTNPSRQDAISPIVNAMQHPNVHLYKHSGVYQFDVGFNLGVFSLVDKENWENVKPVPGDTNIACYHGPVIGAVTDTNWVVTDGMTVDFFQQGGWDIVMLGDLHMHQSLAWREVEIDLSEDELVSDSDAILC